MENLGITDKTIIRIKKRSQFSSILFRYKKNKLAIVGLFIFLLMFLIAVFADQIVSYEEDAISQHISNRMKPPNTENILGTDQYGRDYFARIVFGARISMFVGLATVSIAMTSGALIGSISAYFGGRVDNILMRIMDIFLAIPGIVLAIAIVGALGPSLINLLIAMSISRIPQFARVVRSAILPIKNQEFIEAARACGTSDVRIIMKHILPNAIGPIIVQATLHMATTIIGITSLSFIGLGVQPPTPEWGSMLADARTQMRYNPYLVISPGVAIILVVLSLNFIGDGLRDALDPRLKN